MGDEKKPTVFYVVRVDGEKREDIARSATKEDAEKHRQGVLADNDEMRLEELVIEERDGEY